MPSLKKVNVCPRGCYPVPWKLQGLATSPPGGQLGSLSSYRECWPPLPLKNCSIQKGYSSRPWTDFSPWQDTNRGKLIHNVLLSGAGPIHIATAKTDIVAFYFKSPLQILCITLQFIMNAKLSKQRFWHCYENGLIKTIQSIPHNL